MSKPTKPDDAPVGCAIAVMVIPFAVWLGWIGFIVWGLWSIFHWFNTH